MTTRRSGWTRSWYLIHWARRLATSGRSRSPATTLFFKAELLSMDELPHRAVIDLQPALSKFGNQASQSEISLDPLQQPDTVFAGNRLRPVTANLARRHAAGLS